jgi:hypothetical protein
LNGNIASLLSAIGCACLRNVPGPLTEKHRGSGASIQLSKQIANGRERMAGSRIKLPKRSIDLVTGSEVQMSLSRRSLIQCAALAGIGLSEAGMGGLARAQDSRLSKTVAKYQTHPNGIQRCEICLQFEPPGRCKLVSGDISPKGWCQYFAAKENAE